MRDNKQLELTNSESIEICPCSSLNVDNNVENKNVINRRRPNVSDRLRPRELLKPSERFESKSVNKFV